MKMIFNQFINILFFIIGIILTIYNFITINISFSLFDDFSENGNYFDTIMFLMFYLPLLLWLIIIFIFSKNIFNKKVSKNYGYSYLVFIIGFILYYIFIFNNAKVEYIPKDKFYIIHHDKEFLNENNAYSLVNNFDPQLQYDIQNFNIHCLTDINCSEENKVNVMKQSNEYLKNNIGTYDKYIQGLNNIVKKEYIKSDDDFGSFLSIRGLISTLKFQKIVDKYYIENNKFNLLVDYYNNMYKVSHLLLESDTGLISYIIGSTIRFHILDNFNYLITTDLLNEYQIKILQYIVKSHQIKNIDLTYHNMIKSEYLSSFDINAKLNNSLLFNKEEFLNYNRYVLYNSFIIEKEKNISDSRLAITQVGIYNFLYSHIDYLSHKLYLSDILLKEEDFINNGKINIHN